MRIIAGTARGRRLATPRGQEIRPTSDRARQVLFDLLGQWLTGAVLDLYAGTGALGLEALSRGASRAALVDASKEGQELCRKNAELSGFADQVEVLALPADRALDVLERAGRSFDLILADPPYALQVEGWLLERLAPSTLLAPGARLVLESERRTPAPDLGRASGLALQAERRLGDTMLRIFQRA